MKALPKKYTQLALNVEPVKRWLQGQRNRVSNEVNALEARGAYAVPWVWTLTAMWLVFAGCCSLIASTEIVDGQEVTRWTPWITAWLVGSGIGGVVSIAWTAIQVSATRALREKARPEFELKYLTGNTLAQRAELIVKAVEDFGFHCNRYREWRRQVDEELVEEDSAAAERYLSFLERAYGVLEQTIRNFTVVAERVAREEQRIRECPERAGASLTALLDELKTGIEQPVSPGAPYFDPIRALEHEEAVARVARELRQFEAG